MRLGKFRLKNQSSFVLDLEKTYKAESNQEDEMRKLYQQLETERILKKEAVNKLTQVMFQRQPQRGGGGSRYILIINGCGLTLNIIIHLISSQRPEHRKTHVREIRKLKGELEQETQKYKRVVEKYQQQLEEIQGVCTVHDCSVHECNKYHS